MGASINQTSQSPVSHRSIRDYLKTVQRGDVKMLKEATRKRVASFVVLAGPLRHCKKTAVDHRRAQSTRQRICAIRSPSLRVLGSNCAAIMARTTRVCSKVQTSKWTFGKFNKFNQDFTRRM